MTRFARSQRVFVIEEPLRDRGRRTPFFEEVRAADGLVVLTPHLPADLDQLQARREVATLVAHACAAQAIDADVAWIDDAGSLRLASHVEARALVWDCGGEDPGTPPELRALRTERGAARADLMLVATHAAADARRRQCASVQVLPTAIDAASFATSGDEGPEPIDQARIPGPRIGVAARIDGQLDYALLRDVVDDRPELQFVVLGQPEVPHRELPCRPNLHWLGAVRRDDVPRYLSAWDLAIAPLATHPDARAREPREPLEALVAGHLLVATTTRELAAQVDASPLVRWSDRAGFGRAIEGALRDSARIERRAHVEAIRAHLGWDAAFARVEGWIATAIERGRRREVDAALERSSA